MLSAGQRALLIQYFKHVELTEEQRNRLAAQYWAAPKPVRTEMALIYNKLFTDGDFVNRLLACHDQARNAAVTPASPGSNTGASAFPCAAAVPPTLTSSASTGTTDEQDGTGGSAPASPASPSGYSSHHGAAPARRTHTQMLLRTAIQDQFPRLVGDGPYVITFEVVESEAQRKEITDLYASQFEHPDPVEIQKLVTLPPCSTRTRRRTNGSYTWYLRCLSTGDAVCAVTVTSHHENSHRFVEMPLFATAAGYKKNGFGKLLNAALREWCSASEVEFIMISADIKAIPFWRHLGYEIMSRQEKNGIAFYYEHECYTFADAEPMICYCGSRSRKRPRGIAASTVRETEVDLVLKQMPRFTLSGAAELPTP